MRLKDFWATILRRWYLLPIALALAVGGTFLVVNRVGPTYKAEGSVLVFPPVATVQRESELKAQGNPYLVLNGVGQARDIVIRALTSKSTRDELGNEHPGSTFDATPDFTNSAPIILITTEADSASEASAALAAVMDRVPQILANLQAGLDLPDQAEITSRPLVADNAPDPVYSGTIRAGLVTAVVALGFGLLFVGLLDGLLTGRTGGKQAASPGEDKLPKTRVAVTTRESDARGQERSRRLGPRGPVRRNGDRLPMADDRQDSADQSSGPRLRSVSVRVEDSPSSARAAKA